MLQRLLFYAKYAFYWLSIFLFFKLIFLIYHCSQFKGISLSDFFGIFTHGLKLDLSLTGYILFLPTLLLIVYSFFRYKIILTIISIYTLIILFAISILLVVDLELYNYWGFRLDDSFLDYINTPQELLASVAGFYYIIVIAVLAIVYLVLFHLYFKKWVLKVPDKLRAGSWMSSLIFTLFLPFLFFFIRGGLNTAPLNTGAVYFHSSTIINHAAVNPVWNFMYTLTMKRSLEYSMTFFDEEKEQEMLKLLSSSPGNTEKVLSSTKPNIILIILESFGGNVIQAISGREGVTPCFGKLIPEGMFFSNLYASGTLSDRGIAAILSGYPGLPETSIIRYENKTQNLPSISGSLQQLGYTSRFLYGGDVNFAHMKSYLHNCRFNKIISHKDFPRSAYYSKWGVPDHIMFNRLLEESNNSTQPFFHVLFTLSSHEPFEVPMETVIKGTSMEARFYNSAYYTDKWLGDFIDRAKQQEWWDNTLVILVADHGTRIGTMTHYDKNRFHIPMLWTGGALNVSDTVVQKYASQTDISLTLLHQLGLSTDEYVFSKDILNSGSKSYAYYSCQNGFGFIADSLFLVYDHTNDAFIEKDGIKEDYQYDLGKASLQKLLKDFKSR